MFSLSLVSANDSNCVHVMKILAKLTSWHVQRIESYFSDTFGKDEFLDHNLPREYYPIVLDGVSKIVKD